LATPLSEVRLMYKKYR